MSPPKVEWIAICDWLVANFGALRIWERLSLLKCSLTKLLMNSALKIRHQQLAKASITDNLECACLLSTGKLYCAIIV